MTREFDTWPHTARKIVEESLREFMGDGEGEDYEVLTAFIKEVQAEALRDAADDRFPRYDIDVWLRARADRLDPREADR